MKHLNYLFLAVLALPLCSCASAARKAAPGAAPAAVPYAVKTSTTAPALSAEEAKKVESLYYRAVGAYGNNDMEAAQKYVDEIFTLYPSYPPAEELRGKIKSVSGHGAVPQPQKP